MISRSVKKEVQVKNRLRALRHERGMPLLGLAAKSRASTATISMIERFDYVPGNELRERIALALSVPTAAIWPDLANSPIPTTPEAGDKDEDAPDALAFGSS